MQVTQVIMLDFVLFFGYVFDCLQFTVMQVGCYSFREAVSDRQIVTPVLNL